MGAALQGYIAYTNCTSALAEVVPYGGKFPTLGTNPHSWAFPTRDAVGFPIVIDWATSTVAMGRVEQFKREGERLPDGAAVDADGKPTTDPNDAVSLLPFGAHRGLSAAGSIGGRCGQANRSGRRAIVHVAQNRIIQRVSQGVRSTRT